MEVLLEYIHSFIHKRPKAFSAQCALARLSFSHPHHRVGAIPKDGSFSVRNRASTLASTAREPQTPSIAVSYQSHHEEVCTTWAPSEYIHIVKLSHIVGAIMFYVQNIIYRIIIYNNNTVTCAGEGHFIDVHISVKLI